MTNSKINGHYLIKGFLGIEIDIPSDNKTKAITQIAAIAAALSDDKYSPFQDTLKEIMQGKETDNQTLALKSLAKQSFEHVKNNKQSYLNDNFKEDAFASIEVPKLVKTYNNPSVADQQKNPHIKDHDMAREYMTSYAFETIFKQLDDFKTKKETIKDETSGTMSLADVNNIISTLTDNPSQLGWQKPDRLAEMNRTEKVERPAQNLPNEISFVSMINAQAENVQNSQEQSSEQDFLDEISSYGSHDSLPLNRARRDNFWSRRTSNTASTTTEENIAEQRPMLYRRDSRSTGSPSLS